MSLLVVQKYNNLMKQESFDGKTTGFLPEIMKCLPNIPISVI